MLPKWIALVSVLFLMVGMMGYTQSEQKQIKVIVFDFGSVIAKTDKGQVKQFIAQSLHISDEEAARALDQLKQFTLEHENEKEFWAAYAKEKGISLPHNWVEKLDEARLHAIKEIPGMVNLVKELQKQGYQTALLSNIRESQAALKRKLGYYNLFHPVILSYEIGIRKPDPQAYKILLNQLKIPPEAIFFIDNRPENVEAAKEQGIDGVAFTTPSQLVVELNKRGIKIPPGVVQP